jgi:hypothetical protein
MYFRVFHAFLAAGALRCLRRCRAPPREVLSPAGVLVQSIVLRKSLPVLLAAAASVGPKCPRWAQLLQRLGDVRCNALGLVARLPLRRRIFCSVAQKAQGLATRFDNVHWTFFDSSTTAALVGYATMGLAHAADMALPLKAPPPEPWYDWSGFYVGLNGGYSWGRSTTDFTVAGLAPFSTAAGSAAARSVGIGNSTTTGSLASRPISRAPGRTAR